MACGDYSGSDVLKERYLSADLAKVPAYNPDCQGEGHVMGMEVGGRSVNMGIFNRPNVRFIPAPKKIWHELLPNHPLLIKLYAAGSSILPKRVFARLASRILTTRGAPDNGLYREGAILVNNAGERFTNELKDPSFPLAKQPGGQAYIVFDSRLAKKFSAWPYFVSTAAGIAYAYVQDYERDVPEIISKGDTLEEAAKIHPKIETLVQTVKRYNRFVEKGKDEDFQRWPLGEGILKPPFYVMGPAVGYIGSNHRGPRYQYPVSSPGSIRKSHSRAFCWRPDRRWTDPHGTWLESRLGLHLWTACRKNSRPFCLSGAERIRTADLHVAKAKKSKNIAIMNCFEKLTEKFSQESKTILYF